MKLFLVTIFLFFSISVFAQADSLVISDTTDLFSLENFFSAQSLNELPKETAIIEQQTQNVFKQYFFLFLLNLLSISIFLLNFSKPRVKKVLSTVFSINLLKQLAQTESKKDNSYLYAYFLLFFIFLLSLVYAFDLVYKLNLDLLLIASAILSLFVFDFILNYMTAFLFKANEALQAIYFNNVSILIVTIPIILIGIFLTVYLPFNTVVITSSFVFIILGLIYFYKEIRNILIIQAHKIKIGSFYFFLYLCTFKILPIMIFVKYLSRNL